MLPFDVPARSSVPLGDREREVIRPSSWISEVWEKRVAEPERCLSLPSPEPMKIESELEARERTPFWESYILNNFN